MKFTVEFGEEERDLALVALNAHEYSMLLNEIHTEVWRPFYKHGYNDEVLDDPKADDIIEKLHERYLEVLKRSGIIEL